ncbi:MAG: hypothetical protein Kow0022_09470 [Phycisphaerales bacterium]
MILGTDARRFGPPFGTITISVIETEHGPAIAQLRFSDTGRSHARQRCASRAAEQLLDLTWAVLETFFATGELVSSIPVRAAGTLFQQQVWDQLRQIRPGTTVTYGQIARRISSLGAARAVGAACGLNPVAILIPCHRVIDARGGLHGYAGGIERKAALLALEGIPVQQHLRPAAI